MMIVTTYFANLNKLPSTFVPISICGKAPDWYTGLQYKKLAPKYVFFQQWKQNHDNDYYIRCFNEQVLSKLNQDEVIRELNQLTGSSVPVDIALVCYEKPGDFCHRHLVADWLNDAGYTVEEWTGG